MEMDIGSDYIRIIRKDEFEREEKEAYVKGDRVFYRVRKTYHLGRYCGEDKTFYTEYDADEFLKKLNKISEMQENEDILESEIIDAVEELLEEVAETAITEEDLIDMINEEVIEISYPDQWTYGHIIATTDEGNDYVIGYVRDGSVFNDVGVRYVDYYEKPEPFDR